MRVNYGSPGFALDSGFYGDFYGAQVKGSTTAPKALTPATKAQIAAARAADSKAVEKYNKYMNKAKEMWAQLKAARVAGKKTLWYKGVNYKSGKGEYFERRTIYWAERAHQKLEGFEGGGGDDFQFASPTDVPSGWEDQAAAMTGPTPGAPVVPALDPAGLDPEVGGDSSFESMLPYILGGTLLLGLGAVVLMKSRS
jgi:hypothetical protein